MVRVAVDLCYILVFRAIRLAVNQPQHKLQKTEQMMMHITEKSQTRDVSDTPKNYFRKYLLRLICQRQLRETRLPRPNDEKHYETHPSLLSKLSSIKKRQNFAKIKNFELVKFVIINLKLIN